MKRSVTKKSVTKKKKPVKQPVHAARNEPPSPVYSVTFGPGPIGVKLEPVVECQGREVGCRIMKFVDGGDKDPGQARQSGKVRLGDLIIAVDGQDVVSWDYPDIIKLLKRNKGDRKLQLRNVWDENSQPLPSTTRKASEPTAAPTVLNEKEKMEAKRLSSVGTRMLNVCCEPSPSTVSSTSTTSPIYAADVSVISVAGSFTTIDEESSETSPLLDQENCFSPSRVKALAASPPAPTQASATDTKPISKVLNTVYNSVAPTAGVVASSSYNITSSLTSAVSTKLGEVLVGHSSNEFNQAVEVKMQLLKELSQAKVCLDAEVQERERLKEAITEIEDSNQVQKDNLETQLQMLHERKVS